MDKYVGKRLDGRYELQELIGVGGMATVYKAYDTIDDKIVAVKILKEEFLGNDDFIRRFKNESKAIAVLSHPNIVKVFDVSFGDRIQYIVMEYIDGITLKEYIEHQKVINWKEAVHFTVQILEALEHAHEKGVVHRDIKPQNIILLQDGTIKVTDFGIARLTTSETRTMTNTAIGSVHYIAPEQARGDLTDGKADIYSVGVMLYEMLTGKLPFEADSAVSVAIMQLQTEPSPLRDINEEIPEGLEEITLKAMRKDPAQRYETAAKMLEAIETFRRNPSVRFNYKYYDDTTSGDTKFVETSIKGSNAPAVPDQLYNDNYDYDEETSSDTRSRTAVKWVTIGIASVVVIAIAVLIFMFTSKSCQGGSSKDVEIPDFIGQMLDDVQSNKSYKFNFKIEVKYDASKPLMMILDQDPKAGTKTVKENSEIILTVNSSESKVNVPTVKGLSQKDAEEKVQKANLYTDIKKVYSNVVDKGYVVDCSPGEGTEQQIGTKITLFISDGPEGETVQIPTKLIGKTKDEVKAELEKLGLKTEFSYQPSTEKKDVVINLEPYEGNTVQKGTLVTIYASNGKLPAGSERKVEIDVGWPNEEAKVHLEVLDDGTVYISEDNVYLPDYGTIEVSCSEKRIKKINIKINDDTYKIFTVDFTKDPPVVTLSKENPYTSNSFKVPSVAGSSEEDARKALISAGFDAANISVEEETSDTVAKGNVTRTNPSEGSVVSAHSSITIFVSKGNGESSTEEFNDIIGSTFKYVYDKYGTNYHFNYDGNPSDSTTIKSYSVSGNEITLYFNDESSSETSSDVPSDVPSDDPSVE
ncbi:Stk1 family PASTA domain-containing Ser/Thr kinase [Pseudoruminococcus massiliensis]|uniref:Stk1 family PASTA domain-containing Ser/Thr kinase n=1 Tax=Pseudoruminococcus massiliensis TaxID=2086583 RepID=UPI003AB1A94F